MKREVLVYDDSGSFVMVEEVLRILAMSSLHYGITSRIFLKNGTYVDSILSPSILKERMFYD